MEMVGWAHGDCVSWMGNWLYRSLILNSGGGWVGQTELSIKLQGWSGGPMGTVVLKLHNFLVEHAKFPFPCPDEL